MTNNPILPIVPPADDGDDDAVDSPDVLADGDRPLDPDVDDDKVTSADADERAAREGELDGDVDDRP